MLQEKLEKLIKENIEKQLFPACVVGAITPTGELVVQDGTYTYEDRRSIKPDSVFDVASITKAMPTACLALKLIEINRLVLHDDIRDYLPDYRSNGDKLTVWNLLTQTVFYEFGHSLSSISHRPPPEILEAIYTVPARVSDNKVTYTNTSSILLGLIVEKLYGLDLAEAGRREFFEPLGMRRTGFDPLAFAPKNEIIPTEHNPKRGLVHARVHDESAFGLKPMNTGTAGLFTTAPDLLKFLKMLLDGGELNGKVYFSANTIKQMAQNQLTGGACHGLGWELNQPHYMGKYSNGAFGKTGFTGCLVLCNPKLRSGLVILSNHVHPRRPNTFEPINQFRRGVADLVFGSAGA